MSKRKLLLEKLTKDMNFCPICGEKLKPMGRGDALNKTCPSMHGTMYVIGQRQGSRVGILMEVFEE